MPGPGQGTIIFFDNRSTTALEAILQLIEKAERIDVAMAFLSAGGWRRLRDALTTFAERGGRLRVVLRWDRWRISLSAVSALRELPNTQVRFHNDPNFHAKWINFYYGGKLAVLLGSANLTVGGRESNPEDGVILVLDTANPEGRQCSQAFEAWWRECMPVTEVELQQLRAERGERRLSRERETESTADAARQRQRHLQTAQRLFELAQATENERHRLVEQAEAYLARAKELEKQQKRR